MAAAASPGSGSFTSSDWIVLRDGCLLCDEEGLRSLSYHPALNAILAVTSRGSIKVVDGTSGAILQASALHGEDLGLSCFISIMILQFGLSRLKLSTYAFKTQLSAALLANRSCSASSVGPGELIYIFLQIFPNLYTQPVVIHGIKCCLYAHCWQEQNELFWKLN